MSPTEMVRHPHPLPVHLHQWEKQPWKPIEGVLLGWRCGSFDSVFLYTIYEALVGSQGPHRLRTAAIPALGW